MKKFGMHKIAMIGHWPIFTAIFTMYVYSNQLHLHASFIYIVGRTQKVISLRLATSGLSIMNSM